MHAPSYTGQFKRDRKQAKKRSWDVAHLDNVVFVRTGSHVDLFG